MILRTTAAAPPAMLVMMTGSTAASTAELSPACPMDSPIAAPTVTAASKIRSVPCSLCANFTRCKAPCLNGTTTRRLCRRLQTTQGLHIGGVPPLATVHAKLANIASWCSIRPVHPLAATNSPRFPLPDPNHTPTLLLPCNSRSSDHARSALPMTDTQCFPRLPVWLAVPQSRSPTTRPRCGILNCVSLVPPLLAQCANQQLYSRIARTPDPFNRFSPIGLPNDVATAMNARRPVFRRVPAMSPFATS